MHASALAHMARCVETYLPKDRSYRVVDLGSRCSPNQSRTHREVLRGHSCQVVGVDVQPGRNVDLVMERPYTIPLRSNDVDVVLSGQAFEHIPFFWATTLEVARVLRPGGWFFLTAPSRGHVHDTFDCWRYYPDGYRAMAAFSGLTLVEAHTDFPPTRDGLRHDYAAIDAVHYWGDSVGVFRKPEHYPALTLAVVRGVVTRWANRVGDLGPGTDGDEPVGPGPPRRAAALRWAPARRAGASAPPSTAARNGPYGSHPRARATIAPMTVSRNDR